MVFNSWFEGRTGGSKQEEEFPVLFSIRRQGNDRDDVFTNTHTRTHILQRVISR